MPLAISILIPCLFSPVGGHGHDSRPRPACQRPAAVCRVRGSAAAPEGGPLSRQRFSR